MTRFSARTAPAFRIGAPVSEQRAAYLFLLPWLAGLALLLVLPLAWAAYISVTNERLLRIGEFVGFANYEQIFTGDRLFPQALGVTLRWLVLTTPLFIVAGLAIALLLNQRL